MRTAAQVPAYELDDLQRAARGLLATGLVTDRWPAPGLLPLVRRFEGVLRAELSQLFGWTVRVDAHGARVVRTPLVPDARRGLRLTEKGGSSARRAFAPRDYAMVCLVLAAIESEGAQTTIRRLVDGVERARSHRADLVVDFTHIADRRSFVTAIVWLIQIGVLSEDDDADTFRFIDDAEADALYGVDHDLARSVLAPRAGRLDPDAGIEALLAREPPSGKETFARQRLARRLVEQPAVYARELDDTERRVLADRRVELSERLERLTGCQVEARAEGVALVDPDSSVRLGASPPFPGNSNAGNIAAIWLAALRDTRTDVIDVEPPVGVSVDAGTVDATWSRTLDTYRSSLAGKWRADEEGLRREALRILQGLGLVADQPGRPGALVVRPLAGRYAVSARPPTRRDDDSAADVQEGP